MTVPERWWDLEKHEQGICVKDGLLIPAKATTPSSLLVPSGPLMMWGVSEWAGCGYMMYILLLWYLNVNPSHK